MPKGLTPEETLARGAATGLREIVRALMEELRASQGDEFVGRVRNRAAAGIADAVHRARSDWDDTDPAVAAEIQDAALGVFGEVFREP